MLRSIAVNSINHVLQRHGWAKKRLQLFAGKVAHIKINPVLAFSFAVDEQGGVHHADEQSCIDTRITVDLNTLPKIFYSDEYLYRYLKVSGNHDFATELVRIVQNIDFDVAQDLSYFIGDIPAHRAAKVSNEILNWHLRGLQNVSQAINEYLTEEPPTLAKSEHALQFTRDVQILSTQTEQLEQRLNQMTHKAFF